MDETTARALAPAIDARRFELTTAVSPAPTGQVVLAATERPIGARHASQLREFVRRGGGLVLLGGTLTAWSDVAGIRDLAGWAPTGPGPVTELVLRPTGEPEWKLRDALYLAEGPPADATVLVGTSWRYTEQVVAYERRFGDGRFVYLGLGTETSTYEDANFQRLLARLLLLAAGRDVPEPMGVGLLGYGAIARDHAASIVATPGLRLAAVCDLSAERREAAVKEWPVKSYARQEDLLDDPTVGLVVVGTPPSAHAGSVLAALRAGKHVVSEKPFALRAEEADRMIDEARSRGLALTVYQSRRWDPDYLAMRDVVQSSGIGEVFYMESFIGGFEHPCDFWHSHEPISGGTIYDWGSHYFDWILQLFDARVVSVAAQAHKRVWHDVTNADQVSVSLTFDGGAQAMFLQSDIASVRKPKWYVLGTEGAIVGDWADQPVPADFPAIVRVYRRSGVETLNLPQRDDAGFYRNVAEHLSWDEPLAVHAEEARRNVAVMEAATESMRLGGKQLKVDI
jgi:predicted dehydrogenase